MDSVDSSADEKEIAVQRLTGEMLSQILEFAEHPQELARYLTDYMRGMFRADKAVLMRAQASEDRPEHAVVAVCPARKAAEAAVPELYRLAEASLGAERAQRWEPRDCPSEAAGPLARLAASDAAWSRCLVIPLAFRKNRFGEFIVVGQHEAAGFSVSLAAFEPLAPFVALILRNAFLFQEQERVIAQRSREILRKERKYQALAEIVPVGIVRSDASGGLIYANERFLRMADLDAISMVGGDWLKAVHPEDREAVQLGWETCARERIPFAMEFRFQKKSGEISWVYGQSAPELDDENALAGYVGTVTDITELKMAERTIDREKERLAVTLRSIGEGVIAADASGKVLTLNEAAEAMTGWKAEEARGLPFGDIFSAKGEDGGPAGAEALAAALEGAPPPRTSVDAKLRSRDGREIFVSFLAAPIREEGGDPIGAVLVFRDSGEQRELAEALQREQRLESLGLLAGGIAHDFNNLLSGIFGNIERAGEALASGKDAARYIRNALGVFGRARALTQQLLTFSAGGEPARRPTDLGRLVEEATRFAASGSNVSCGFEIEEGLPACDCDENQIGQAVSNLALNAVQAMPRGGELRVSVTGAGAEGLRVSVKDAGVGIQPQDLKRIFDPFFTTKDSGHGLGLATAFSIVQRHGGRIEVDSEPGKGSEFRVYLPASSEPCRAETPTASADFTGQGKILIMDDEEFLLELLSLNLEDMGYRVVSASGGREAISLFKRAEEEGEGFDAAILDLTVPGDLGGKATAEALLKIRPGAVLVATSGYSQDPVMSDPAAYGFKAKLPKPYRREQLTGLMRELRRAG